MDEPMLDVDGRTDPLDPHPCDPSTSRKIPLWLKDTLQDFGKFWERKKPNRYQGYLATIIISFNLNLSLSKNM